jgi:hypothetical protein
LEVAGDMSGMYLGGDGDAVSSELLAAVVKPESEPEEKDEVASDEDMVRKAVTSD